MDASFTDVDIGFKYKHGSSPDAPENELDVICTKGSKSLFISCKMKTASLFDDDKNLLNYICYEIRLQAELFGVNAKPVIVAPSLPQFIKNGETWEISAEVKKASRRGVYLIGKECLTKDNLGLVLENIIFGKDDWCKFLKPSD